jgi:hypothetical protein
MDHDDALVVMYSVGGAAGTPAGQHSDVFSQFKTVAERMSDSGNTLSAGGEQIKQPRSECYRYSQQQCHTSY